MKRYGTNVMRVLCAGMSTLCQTSMEEEGPTAGTLYVRTNSTRRCFPVHRITAPRFQPIVLYMSIVGLGTCSS